MRKHIAYIIVVLIFLLLIGGCSTTQEIKNIGKPEVLQKEPIIPQEPIEETSEIDVIEKDLVLHLISTTHVKGNLFPYDVIQDKDLDYSLMSVSQFANDLRDAGERVVLLNSGDNLLNNPLLYYYNNIETTTPHIVPEVYNKVGYDVVTIGQRDIEVGKEAYMRVLDQSNFPYVGANIIDESTKEPLVDPYVMIEKDGVSIAVVGLIDPLDTPWYIDGIMFDDMVETAARWIPIIREKEKPDLLVALVSTERENFGEMAKEAIIHSSNGFDIIIGGTQTTPLVVKDLDGKDIHIVGSSSKGESVQHLEVVFNTNNNKVHTLSSITSKDVKMNQVEVDQALLDSYTEVIDKVTSWAQTKVGEVKESFSSRDAMFNDSAFVDTIHSVQRALTSADISMSAPLTIDTTIEKGDVKIVDLFKLYPQYHHIVTMEFTGEEVRDMAMYSYSGWFNPMTKLDDDLIRFKIDENGEYIFNKETNSFETHFPVSSFDSYSGMNYIVNIAKPKEIQVVIKTMEDGKAFDTNSTYRVALNSSRAEGVGGHLEVAGITKEMAKSRIVSISEKDMIYYLLKEIGKYRTIELTYDNNWLVIPALWAKEGMENSYPKLFGETL